MRVLSKRMKHLGAIESKITYASPTTTGYSILSTTN